MTDIPRNLKPAKYYRIKKCESEYSVIIMIITRKIKEAVKHWAYLVEFVTNTHFFKLASLTILLHTIVGTEVKNEQSHTRNR